MLRIETQIKSWVKVAEMPSLMKRLADMMGEDVLDISTSSGRGTWKERIFPGGRAVLGYIRRNLRKESGETYAQVSWNSAPHNPIVAFAHEFGAIINVTQRMRGFFYHRYRETGQRFWLGMFLRKSSTIVIPQRSVIEPMTQAQNVQRYADFIGANLIVSATSPETT